MAKVLGVGGVFFTCADMEVTRGWYARVLGMSAEEFGGFVLGYQRAVDCHGRSALTVFAPFENADYFQPSPLPFMINLMVDDLDAMLVQVAAEGVEELQPREDNDYGHFAWIMDPDGRKIELWQPPSQSPPA